MKKSIVLILIALLASCGKKDNATSSRTSAFNQAYKALEEATPNVSSSSFVNSLTETNIKGPMIFATNLSDGWDLSTNFMSVDSTELPMKDYVGTMLDEETDQSVFNRAKTPFLISCCLDILAPKNGDGTFQTGTHAVAFTNAVVGICGQTSDFTTGDDGGSLIGQTINITVSNLSNTTNYDQKIYFPESTNPFGSDQWMFVRNNSSVLNFAHIEEGDSDIYVSTITFNKDSETGSFQYVSKGTNQHNLFRIRMDEDNNDSRVYIYKKTNVSGAPKWSSFFLSSTFSNHTHAAINGAFGGAGLSGYAGGSGSNLLACVSTTTGNITATGATCSSNSKEVPTSIDASAIVTLIDGASLSASVTKAQNDTFASILPTYSNDTEILDDSLGL